MPRSSLVVASEAADQVAEWMEQTPHHRFILRLHPDPQGVLARIYLAGWPEEADEEETAQEAR